MLTLEKPRSFKFKQRDHRLIWKSAKIQEESLLGLVQIQVAMSEMNMMILFLEFVKWTQKNAICEDSHLKGKFIHYIS